MATLDARVQMSGDETCGMNSGWTFLGFDCALRTLGWCAISVNPRAFVPGAPGGAARVLRHIASGVIDVTGEAVSRVSEEARADRLARAVNNLVALLQTAHDVDIARTVVIIERQPRFAIRGGAAHGVHGDIAHVGAYIMYHFVAVARAAQVRYIDARHKNNVAAAILREDGDGAVAGAAAGRVGHARGYRCASIDQGAEPPVGYRARKLQTVRAMCALASAFEWNCAPPFSPDVADACLQICAAIFAR